ncbi:hypothetical protein [Bradyrhizobium symbiodeficiens]|uniref:Uncharacterized protein n=1 Tax=Bradyrhizobium symbiodeficiens TaxID=1404367 RepID=A0ABZ2F0V2_9BRAD|nr:hypothetical protein [Bradyrhizobium symbiodeficiens]
MSASAQTLNDCQLNSIEAIEKRLAMIANMQRRLKSALARTEPGREQLH